MISLSITSCKRKDLFIQTINSLFSNCLDISLISEVVWSDDNTDNAEYNEMKDHINKFLSYKIKKVFQHREGENKGLSHSLNFILDNISNKYCLHIEDDWTFNKGLFITEGYYLLDRVPYAYQVLLKDRPMFQKRNTLDNLKFYEWSKGVALDGQNVEHAGFTLNPSIIKWKWIKENYGYFNSYGVEGSFADRLYNDGHRTITTIRNYINHIGLGESSFNLNGTPR